MKAAKTSLSGDTQALKDAKTKFEAKLHKLTETIYKQSTAQQQDAKGPQGGGASQQSQGDSSTKKEEDNVVDAEVEDDSEKK